MPTALTYLKDLSTLAVLMLLPLLIWAAAVELGIR